MTSDFVGRLPVHLRPVGQHVDVAVVPSDSALPNLTLEQQNAATKARFRELHPPKPLEAPHQQFPLPDKAQATAALETARRMLAAAIERRNARQAECDHAADVLRVGREAVADLQGRLEEANAVDTDVAEYLAEHVGEELAPELVERRAERDRVAQKHRDACAAAAVLQQHFESAQTRLREAESVVRDRVQDVVSHHLEIQAARLIDIERVTLAHLRTVLDMIDAGAKASPATRQALHEARSAEDRSAPAVRAARLQKWRDMFTRLAVDANTEIAIEPADG